MKTNSLLSSTLIVMLIGLIVSCKEQRTDWQGTKEEIGGVTHVMNPNEPVYGELVLNLEEDLSIGNEEDENYLLFRIREIEVDEEGNIYVLESGNLRVQKFDPSGNYLCTIGKKGQGPGEFQMPFQMIINDRNGTIGVQDMRKLVVFDKGGNYIDKDIHFENFYTELLVDSQGFMWGNMYRLEGEDEALGDQFNVFVKLDRDGQIDKEVAFFPYDNYRERRGEGVLSIATGEEHELFVSGLDEQRFVYGYSGEYELYVVDLEGNLIRRIKKDEPYQNFTAEEKNKYKRAKIPEYKPFLYALFSDSEGRIYVQRNNARQAEQVEKVFDVFSNDGYYIYRTVCTLTPYLIEKGYFYTRIADEETGGVFVKRYKIKNWDQIKTGIN